MSNHYHLLLASRDAASLASFMQYLNSNLARELGRLHDWREKLWSRRYRAAPVLDEASHIERLQYILANSVKEGLVKHVRYWPGVHCYGQLVEKRPLRGVWVNRSKAYEARSKDEVPFTERLTLSLAKLPCWSHLTDSDYRERVRELSREMHESLGPRKRVLGQKKILKQHPHTKPKKSVRSPAPLCHAACSRLRQEFRLAFKAFVADYRRAFSEVATKTWGSCFPPGGIPPVAWCARPLPAPG